MVGPTLYGAPNGGWGITPNRVHIIPTWASGRRRGRSGPSRPPKSDGTDSPECRIRYSSGVCNAPPAVAAAGLIRQLSIPFRVGPIRIGLGLSVASRKAEAVRPVEQQVTRLLTGISPGGRTAFFSPWRFQPFCSPGLVSCARRYPAVDVEYPPG